MSVTDILLFQDHQEENYQLIGKGGFGKVFRVFNNLDNQYYAIKQIRVSKENLSHALNEIRILASISHPHVIRYHHSWISTSCCHDFEDEVDDDDEEDDMLMETEGNLYFFNIQMEYCPSTLRKYLKERTVVDVSHCYAILHQMMEGLLFLHQHAIIHRDVKPDNVLISSFQPFHVKITDFGIAKKIAPSPSPDASSYVGTCLYAAPEQSQKKFYYVSDVYSMGIIMLELQYLFSTEMERIRCIQELKQQRKVSCVYFGSLLLEMTDPDPMKRPTLSMIKNKWFVSMDTPLILCRDLVLNIVNNILDTVVEESPEPHSQCLLDR